MLKQIFKDNKADENVTKLVWVCIVFVVGAIILAIVYAGFHDVAGPWLTNTFTSWWTNAWLESRAAFNLVHGG